MCQSAAEPFECSWEAGTTVLARQIRVVAELTGGGRVVRTVRTKALGYAEKVDVDVVQVIATVTDNTGHFVAGLPRSAFKIEEDGKAQKISHFGSEDVPLELIVAVDVSGSMAPAMPRLKMAVKEFLGAVPSRDQVTLIGFNDSIFALTRRTVDPAERIKAVDRLAPWGATALYDVILRGVDMLGKQPGRRAIVVFSDGEDQGSHASITDVERRLQASDVTLYMIGQGRGVEVAALKTVMQRLVEPTGGRALFTDSIDQLHSAFEDLLEELSNQYLLGYESSNARRDDSFRKITVTGGRSTSRAGPAGLPRDGTQMIEPATRGARGTPRRRRGSRAPRAAGSSALAGTAPARVSIGRRNTSARRDGGERPRRTDPRPIATDFTVRLDGRPRRVLNAQWVPSASSATSATAAPALPDGYVSNEQSTGGRLIVLVIDQPNIPFGEMRTMRDAVEAFIDRLSPADRVAIVGFGTGAKSTSFMSDHDQLKRALALLPGQQQQQQFGGGTHDLGLATALAIERGDDITLSQVVMRDCQGTPRAIQQCRQEIQAEAQQVAGEARLDSDLTLRSLRDVLTNLRAVDAPKTLLLVSQGFLADNQRDDASRVTDLGGLAAAARTSIYAFRLETNPTDVTRARGSNPSLVAEDRRERRNGLEALTSSARGALFDVAGTGTSVFERVTSELSGYVPPGRRTRLSRLRRQAAPDSRRRRPNRADGTGAPDHDVRRRRRSGRRVSDAARSRDGGAQFAAAGGEPPASRHRVHVPRPRGRQSTPARYTRTSAPGIRRRSAWRWATTSSTKTAATSTARCPKSGSRPWCPALRLRWGSRAARAWIPATTP